MKTLFIAFLLTMSINSLWAQDMVIRRNTTTTTTTTSTTTVSKPKLKPQPPKPTTGTLTITSTPSGAVVKIDGKYMGETPLTMEKQKPNTYNVTFSAEGYETTTLSVTVTAGQTDTCSATLKSNAASQTITANGVSFKMIRVDGGTFTMGATSEQGNDAWDYEKPAHQVTLSSYYIGETEVTQALWEAVMGSNPSYFNGSNRPVEQVTWDDCQAFIHKLNSLTGKSFRLPTEAEWEFASRGGTKSQSYKFSGSNHLSAVAWYRDNSGNETHPVKTKSPNELGIYDMSGNVFEWCQDVPGAYSSSPQRDPMVASSSTLRVNRGGGWYDYARSCRVSFRQSYTSDSRNSNLGLRLVL